MNFNEIEPSTYDKYTFGKCIRMRREELGLSLKKVSEILDMSIIYLSEIERGNRNPTGKRTKKDFLSKFIVALEIPSNQIEAFYNMAFVSIDYYKDIEKYLYSNFYAKEAIRLAKEMQLSDEEWKEIICMLEEKKSKV